MARVQLYTKDDCSLCEKAKAVLYPVCEAEGVEVETIDILQDPVLVAAYGEEIPVVLIDGKKCFMYRIDDVDRLRALIRAGHSS